MISLKAQWWFAVCTFPDVFSCWDAMIQLEGVFQQLEVRCVRKDVLEFIMKGIQQ